MTFFSTYTSPLSIRLGAYYDFGNFKLHFATDYFNKINKYNILLPEPFLSQTDDIAISNDLTAAYDEVLNYGLGLEYYFNPKFTFYLAFNTDFSVYAMDVETTLKCLPWS